VQAVLDVQDTEEKPPEKKLVGLGTVWTDQLVPFQLSANPPLPELAS
jgi:hypothetical protein